MQKLTRRIEPVTSIDTYLAMTELTESPLLFHRWCFISGVGALLARNVWLPFGEWKIYPNFYINLIGPPGSRKSVAISAIGELLKEAGYEHFSGDRSSKEKFMMDWEFGFDKIARGIEPEDKKSIADCVDELLTPDGRDASRVSEVYIKASELEDFLGSGNSGFISTLTNLWDNPAYYTDRFKNSKSLYIPNPTVNLLGGATTTTFASIFSTSIIGQGMLSRMILVHGKGQRMRLTIPPAMPMEYKKVIVDLFRTIRSTMRGELTLGPGAYEALEMIYEGFVELKDSRFASYCSRRFTHLLKLCIIIATSELRMEITVADILYANTILSYTELGMPKALGEFGKSRNSEISNIVLDAIMAGESNGGVTARDLIKAVSQDVDSSYELQAIVLKLVEAEKVIKGMRGEEPVFLPVRRALDSSTEALIDYDLLWEHRLGSF